MTITFDNNIINNIDLTNIAQYIEWSKHKDYFLLDSGKEQYKLLAYLSTTFNNSIIINIGTGDGLDTNALSYNENNKVITCDYEDVLPSENSIKNRKNIEIRVEDFMDNPEFLLKSALININIHPHDGKEEKNILNYLSENKYSGIIILGNINVTDNMKNLWNNINGNKVNITKYGYWGGTGIICSENIILE